MRLERDTSHQTPARDDTSQSSSNHLCLREVVIITFATGTKPDNPSDRASRRSSIQGFNYSEWRAGRPQAGFASVLLMFVLATLRSLAHPTPVSPHDRSRGCRLALSQIRASTRVCAVEPPLRRSCPHAILPKKIVRGFAR